MKKLILLLALAFLPFSQGQDIIIAEEGPPLVVADEVMKMGEKMIACYERIPEEFKKVKDKLTADAAAYRITDIIKEQKALRQMSRDTCSEVEAALAFYMEYFEYCECEDKIVAECKRIEDKKFYESEPLEDMMRIMGYVKPLAVHQKTEWAYRLENMRSAVVGCLFTVKDKKSADRVAEKLTRCRKIWEETLKTSGIKADEIHLHFGAVILCTDTLISYKNAQKQRLDEVDYYGSKALREQVEQWDKLIPTVE